MKTFFALLLLVLLTGAGCRGTRPLTSTSTTKDSSTVVTSRPVALQIPADTAAAGYALDKFTQAVLEAPEGHVIDAQRGPAKVAGYRIIRAGAGFQVVATAAGRDTTIYVHDTLTMVRERTLLREAPVAKPSALQEAKELVYSIFWVLLLLVIAYLILRFTQRRS